MNFKPQQNVSLFQVWKRLLKNWKKLCDFDHKEWC
jgi:hypothetical protein